MLSNVRAHTTKTISGSKLWKCVDVVVVVAFHRSVDFIRSSQRYIYVFTAAAAAAVLWFFDYFYLFFFSFSPTRSIRLKRQCEKQNRKKRPSNSWILVKRVSLSILLCQIGSQMHKMHVRTECVSAKKLLFTVRWKYEIQDTTISSAIAKIGRSVFDSLPLPPQWEG